VTISSFEELPLRSTTLDAVARAGYITPTPIQARAIGIALTGRDLIGCAQTGTGKTAAFAIPTIERLAAMRPGAGARALVLAPTRELALQIAQTFAALGPELRTVTLIGGEPMGPQLAGLGRRPDVIVATPGRLIDHVERRSATLASLRIVVLDEADRMLDMGFAPQVERILAMTPLDRQTLCFSATMPEGVERLVRTHLSRPERVAVGVVAKPVAAVTQRLYATENRDKTPLLLRLLGEDGGQTLVFTRTKHRADRLARAIASAGHRVTRLHADRTMSQRREALDGFRAGRYRVLIATDIAARGIDVPDIAHVVNFDLPHTAEDYIHRIGRTARAQARGQATSFATPEDRDQLRAIERHLGHPVPRHRSAGHPTIPVGATGAHDAPEGQAERWQPVP
jgi:ATP-dependent RNA helicase RhlE